MNEQYYYSCQFETYTLSNEKNQVTKCTSENICTRFGFMLFIIIRYLILISAN